MSGGTNGDPSPFARVISLGQTCSTKYQVGRHAVFRCDADATESAYRALVWSSRRKPFGTYVFDWQITPFDALVAYLESDFRGTFERAALQPWADGSDVLHRTLETQHPHAFHAPENERITENLIDRQFPEASRKHEHLATKTRAALSDDLATLYVLQSAAAPDRLAYLITLLERRVRHRFHLLVIRSGADTPAAPPPTDRMTIRTAPSALIDKPEERWWEGDDATWDDMLAPFGVVLDR